MVDDPTQNSRNPANSGGLSGALAEIMGKFLAGVDDMLPAVVIEYDRTENRATVRPLIKILKTDGTVVNRAQIASVPVLNLGGGGVVLSFNIVPGDLGWIKASDRDISLFLQNETDDDVPPNTLRKHNFGDALFIPDKFRNRELVAADAENTVLQTADGLHRISIGEGIIRLSSADDLGVHVSPRNILIEPDGISINSIDENVAIIAPGTVIVGNMFLFAGVLNIFGDIASSTIISAGTDVLAPGLGGVSLANHVHSGVTVGAGNTGPPV